MSFFDENPERQDEQRKVAFQTVVAMRDALSIAEKTPQKPTYEKALSYIYDLDPDLYPKFTSLLSEKNENDVVKKYKELANIASLEGAVILPEDLIQSDINQLIQTIDRGKENGVSIKHLQSELRALHGALENLKPRRISEHAILTHDFAQASRDYVGDKIVSEFKYVDYSLSDNRVLRLRLLHPDNDEVITGADLIYEQHNIDTEQIRFVFLQYKVWDDCQIYFSAGNLKEQLEKLRTTLCENHMCASPARDTPLRDFRLPYCSGFLRPTDRLQHQNSKMVSSGLHIPVCHAAFYADQDTKLAKKVLKKTSPSHIIFEKLFNIGLVGSRLLSYSEVEEFYKQKEILTSDQTLKVYAKEYLKTHNMGESSEG